MSRVANVTAAFSADMTDVDAKFNALVARAQQGIPIHFTGGGPASSTTSTLGGMSVSGSTPFPAGSASPNFSFLGSQIAQQISASLAPALQQMTSAIPISSPNWGGYFGGIQQQLQAMTPTSSPAWGPLIQSSMQSAMFPVGSSSPNWSYLLANRGGGGGGGGGQPGFFRGGIRRTAFAAGTLVAGLNAIATHFTRARDIDEMIGRGDVDEALQAQLTEAHGNREGLVGLFRSFTGFYDDEQDEMIARQGIASRRFVQSRSSIVSGTRRLLSSRRAIGMGEVDRTAQEGMESVVSLQEQQQPLREQADSLNKLGMGAESKSLNSALNKQMDAAKNLADAQNKEAERLRSIATRSTDRQILSISFAANNLPILADRERLIDSSQRAVDLEDDPLKKAKLQSLFTADLSAFDIGTSRSFRFSADDAEARAGISRLRANRDVYGAERAGVAMRRNAALRAIPQNWFTDLLGGRRLRKSVNDEFDAQLGEIGASEDFENGGMQRTISGRNASLQFLLDRQPLNARINSINTERDRQIGQLQPDQEYMEGGIRTGARREGQLATREDAENRAMIGFRLSSATSEILSQFKRDPLGAQLLGIQTDAAGQAAQLIGQGNSSAAIKAILLGFARSGLAQRQNADLIDRANLNLGGERDQLQALLHHDPVGASVAGIVTSGMDKAIQFGNRGMRDQQISSLRNTMLQLDLTKQSFEESFHAVEIGQNFDTSSPRGQASMEQIMKDIQGGIDKLTQAIKDATSAK